MTGTLTFPNDLIRPIVENVENDAYHGSHTLTVLALVCSSFKAESERLLYRSMTTPTPERQLGFIHTVANVVSRAKHVLSYTLMDPIMLVIGKSASFMSDLERAFANMVNLKELDYTISKGWEALEGISKYSSTKFISPIQLLESSYSFQLESLRLHGDKVYFTSILPFLSSQSNIQSLFIRCADVRGEVDSSILPNLRSLHGSFPVIKSFLSTRNIQSLSWHIDKGDSYTGWSNMGDISSKLSQLESLSFHIPSFSHLTRHFLFSSNNWQSLRNLQLSHVKIPEDILFLRNIPSLRMFLIPKLAKQEEYDNLEENGLSLQHGSIRPPQAILHAYPNLRFCGEVNTLVNISTNELVGLVYDEYTIWDSKAHLKDQPKVYIIPEDAAWRRSIFDLIPHGH